jgi:hypothetical protein
VIHLGFISVHVEAIDVSISLSSSDGPLLPFLVCSSSSLSLLVSFMSSFAADYRDCLPVAPFHVGRKARVWGREMRVIGSAIERIGLEEDFLFLLLRGAGVDVMWV